MLPVITTLCVAVSTYLIAYVVFHKFERLISACDLKKKFPHKTLFIKIVWPVAFYVSPYVSKILKSHGNKWIEKTLISAGLDDVLRPSEFVACWFCFSVLSGVITAISTGLDPTSSVFVLCIGSIFYLISIKARSRKRSNDILKGLPFVMDMLALSVEAGLDFVQSTERIATRLADSSMRIELEKFLDRIRMGMTRRESLRVLGNRSNLRELAAFSSVLAHAEKLGTPIALVLKSESASMRARRFSAAERRGVLASQLALLPLVFCVMPATFVIIFGPILVKIFTGGFEAFFI